MAALTAGNLIDEVAAFIGTGGSSSDDYRTSLLRFVNWSCRDIWGRHPWPERLADFFVGTTAPGPRVGPR